MTANIFASLVYPDNVGVRYVALALDQFVTEWLLDDASVDLHPVVGIEHVYLVSLIATLLQSPNDKEKTK